MYLKLTTTYNKAPILINMDNVVDIVAHTPSETNLNNSRLYTVKIDDYLDVTETIDQIYEMLLS